jgi:integrase/recombinase XerD
MALQKGVEMIAKTKTDPGTFASIALTDAYTDFVLSRQAMNCTKATIDFYRHTARVFLVWSEGQGVDAPEKLSARYVRAYLAELVAKGKKDTTLNAHARAIRTLCIFWHTEGYIPQPIKFEMPKLEKKRLPVLNAEQLQRVVEACDVRDKAIVLFMADSGLRRQETVDLNWGDVDMDTGLVRVKQGKGQKDRSAVIGATTRRVLLKYRRTVDHSPNSPLFQSRTHERFTGHGLLIVFRRLSKATGIRVTPHAMRRTFTILSLRAGMNALTIQTLLGHEDLTMTKHYADMVDDDLLAEHKAHSPIDNLR